MTSKAVSGVSEDLDFEILPVKPKSDSRCWYRESD